ncbi:MAG: hypothetical protein QOH13_1101, partial [Thermoleophilaceae bacterium]|nr:hypothetical protein [Thermoleophilaceae bacterium]
MTPVYGSVDAARAAVTDFFSEEIGDNRGRDRRVMARALGSLFFAGGLIALVSLVLPHWGGTNVAGITTVCTIALALGVSMTFEDGRLPRWTFPVACLGATLLITLAIYYSDRVDSPYSFY